jgi:NhaP-type Na+/H+ or K+/H+ antiporter
MGAKKMKQRSIAYWTATVFVSCVIGISGILAITHAGLMMKALSHLGYPRYFSNLLGIGKLAGVFVLLAPGMPRLKEWAYVGCGIAILSASYSHYSSGDGLMALEPLVTFAALVISYMYRPASRRLEAQPLKQVC